MTIDEAIKHAEEVAKEKDIQAGFDTDYVCYQMSDAERNECQKCAEEHRQLAEWLKDYKRLLEQQPIEEMPCVSSEEMQKCKDIVKKYTPKQQPCENAISRQAVLDAMYELCDTGETLKENPWRDNPHIDAIIDVIENLPPVTPQQKYGKWIKHPEIETSTPEYLMFYECSECGDKQCFCKSDIHKKRFCSNCGAKMQESEV